MELSAPVPAAAVAHPSAAAVSVPSSDARYTFDETRLQSLRSSAPWSSDPKYFKSASFSPSAVMKMLMHCHSGVEKGLKKGGNPIEVMGLMLGRPDPDTPRTLVVTDVFPLPIEGFETRVIADDQDVVNYMIELGESLERTRKEKFMGWYHSHPFDVGINSHCFLSQTDLTTQLQWQRAEDPHGNPFLAVVIDPLRSLAKNVPEMKAFRAYPPEYNSPVTNECPDGSVIGDEQARLERWGSCWARYYELGVETYMSGSARNVMGILTNNFLWMRTLGSTPMLEVENRDRFPDRVTSAADQVRELDLIKKSGDGGGGMGGGWSGGGMADPFGDSFGQSLGLAGRGGSGGGRRALAAQARGMGGPPPAPSGGSSGGIAASAPVGSSSSEAGGGGNAPSLVTGGDASGSGSGAAAAGGTAASSSAADDEGELGKASQAVMELATEKLHGNIGQVIKKGLFL
mmetsp:Transcript_8334/g.18003  ORF Transcript_8334/g.18003 Transcript_8334/m.18003 type:complete len:458 (-) Transcript_8334:125-1498(-)